jgi:UDP:flavonoid glycosyltransferase YjiC (YdhE family)
VRVLVASLPLWGHVQPLVPLARAVQRRGDDLLWATGSDACERLAGLDIDTAPAGQTVADFAVARAEGQRRTAHLPPHERPDHLAPWLFGAGRAGPMLRDLTRIVERFEPDLIVHDQAEYASAIAAGVAGIPHVTHGFGDVLPKLRVQRTSDDVGELWRAAGLEPRPYGGAYDHLYLDLYPPSLARSSRDHLGEVQPIRPVPDLPPVPPPLPTELVHLGAFEDRPLVYATFGTVFNDQRLLASVIDAIATLPITVVATTGPDQDPAALGAFPPHVHVAPFVPQDDLLPHCAAVVSHGGSGTFLAALARGLPQLLLPQGADQFLNADAAEHAGVALALGPQDQEPGRIQEALATVLADRNVRDRAGTLAAEIAGMPSADGVVDHLAGLTGSELPG